VALTVNSPPLPEHDFGTTVALIRGMVLAEAASQASGEGVRTEVVGDSTRVDSLEVRVFIGEQSALISFAGIEVTEVLGDAAVRTAVDERIQTAIASRQRHPA